MVETPSGEQKEQRRRGIVLVVDDNQFFLKMQRLMLERAGFEVATASDAAAGLDRFRQSARDVMLVVTDLMMPGMNGRELCREIKAQRSDVPVVLVTGMGEGDDLSQGGFDAVMQKPFNPADLIRVIDELAGRGRKGEMRIAHGA